MFIKTISNLLPKREPKGTLFTTLSEGYSKQTKYEVMVERLLSLDKTIDMSTLLFKGSEKAIYNSLKQAYKNGFKRIVLLEDSTIHSLDDLEKTRRAVDSFIKRYECFVYLI